MELGGVERSLVGLLDSIDYDQYEVDVFIQRHIGDLMPFINSKANLLPEIPAYTTLTRSLTSILKEGWFLIALGRLLAKRKARKRTNVENDAAIFQYVADKTTRFMPDINQNKYDLAISFLQPHNIVREKVTARKKIAWIHTDYSTVSVDTQAELPVWDSFDYIASISESSKEAFCSSFPSLRHKIIVIENALSPDFVRSQAELETVKFDGKINLLSVGRYSRPKAFDRAVEICATIVKLGLDLKWYVLGYGNEEPIRKAIEKFKMKDHFILLGKKSNPYPFMKACDLYVQPSRYEGKAVAVREAQMLGKPVVITDFPTAKDQLKDGFDGIIVPMEIDAAAKEIFQLLQDSQRMSLLKKNCLANDYGNLKEVEKIYKLI
jgi:glycosyltransferase involved in cell wall biosynthesis